MPDIMPDIIPDNVTITAKEYQRLLNSDFKLTCLENGGVDDWEWYGESMKPYWEAQEKAENEKAD